MTNKERINKMSCKEFADKYTNREQNCEVCAYWDKERNYCNSCRESNVDECKVGFIKWLSQEAELTADEMFEELGYKKKYSRDYDCIFERKDGEILDKIIILKNHGHCYYYNKHRIINNKYPVYIVTISEAEDEAIHKKIEELKKC